MSNDDVAIVDEGQDEDGAGDIDAGAAGATDATPTKRAPVRTIRIPKATARAMEARARDLELTMADMVEMIALRALAHVEARMDAAGVRKTGKGVASDGPKGYDVTRESKTVQVTDRTFRRLKAAQSACGWTLATPILDMWRLMERPLREMPGRRQAYSGCPNIAMGVSAAARQ